MKTQTKSVAAVLAALVVLWLLYRIFRGSGAGGHATPSDAIAAGWMVYQAGITGWLETSPDGRQQIMHNAGWTGDPFSRA